MRSTEKKGLLLKISNGGRLTKEEKERLASYCEKVTDATTAPIYLNDRSMNNEALSKMDLTRNAIDRTDFNMDTSQHYDTQRPLARDYSRSKSFDASEDSKPNQHSLSRISPKSRSDISATSLIQSRSPIRPAV